MKQILFMIAVVALVGCGTTSWVSDPSDPQNVIVEKGLRSWLKKPTGELTKADLAKVTSLGLSNTKFNDAGLKEVAKMQQLTSLYLDGTKITDAGIEELAKLQKLKTLSVKSTKITDEGAAELRKALPKLKKFVHSYKKD